MLVTSEEEIDDEFSKKGSVRGYRVFCFFFRRAFCEGSASAQKIVDLVAPPMRSEGQKKNAIALEGNVVDPFVDIHGVHACRFRYGCD